MELTQKTFRERLEYMQHALKPGDCDDSHRSDKKMCDGP